METTRRLSVGFFVLYFSVLIFVGFWVQSERVQQGIGGSLHLVYMLLAATFVYVAVRAYLVLGRRVSRRWDAWWVAADLLIVTAAVRLTGGYSSEAALWYFWPIATASIQRRPGQTLAVGLSGTALYVAVTAALEPLDPAQTETLAARIFVFIMATVLATWYARNEGVRVEETATLRERVALADYREGLSREMHDGIQSYLVNIATRLELAKLTIEEDALKAATMAVGERVTARQANDELRYLVRRLRSQALDQHGFVDALRAHMSMFGGRSSIDASLDIEGTAIPLPPDVEHAAFRVIQEALMNAEKHAEASEIKAKLRFALDRFECSLADNGSGFDPSGEQENGGLGFVGMRERAEGVNGALQIKSAPGEGTEITLTVPLEALAPLEERTDGSD